MADRAVKEQQKAYPGGPTPSDRVAATGGGPSAANEVAKAGALHDAGTVRAEEYDQMKARATA